MNPKITTLFLLLVLAGCVGTPVTQGPSHSPLIETSYPPNDFGNDAASVSEISHGESSAPIVVAGFAHFGAYDETISTLYPGELPAKLKAKVGGAYSLGFLIDENLVATLGIGAADQLDFVREFGAILAVPGSAPLDSISYVRVEGSVQQLFAFLGESPGPAEPSLPLILADKVETLTAHELTLDQLHTDFEAILGAGNVARVRTHGIAFGTTPGRMHGGAGPLDIGLYELVAAYRGTEGLQSVRVGMGAIWVGRGQEYLGVDVTVDAYVIRESALREVARVRSASLAKEARSMVPLPTESHLQNPWVENLRHDSVPGFLISTEITPTQQWSPPGLAELHASNGGDLGELTEAVSLVPSAGAAGAPENRIVGAGLKEICGCTGPFDLGVYLLTSFVWDGSSEQFTVYAVPVLHPIRGTAPPLVGQQVQINAIYSRDHVAADAVLDAAHQLFDAKPWGPAVIALIGDAHRYGDSVEVQLLDGFLWANTVSVLPPRASAAPVLLLPPSVEDSSGGSVKLSWFWPHDITVPSYRVFATSATHPYHKEQVADLETATITGLSAGSWTFKVRALYDGTYAPSNRVTITVGGETEPPPSGGGTATAPPAPPASPTLYSVTRCSDDPKHCLRVTWSGYSGSGFIRQEVYQSVAGGPWNLRWTITDPSTSTAVDEGLVCDTYYSYYVRVVTSGGAANSNSLGERPRGPAGFC